MSFNSYQYAVFLPIVFVVYWLVPSRYRWIFMLGASYYFYMSWNPKYVLLIIFTTLVSFFAGVIIEKTDNKRIRQCTVACATMICLGVLFIFKYYNFAIESIVTVASLFSLQLSPSLTDLVLPVGISFYTFQTISYVIDVYRRNMPAEKHLGYYATYVAFFPQLVAGPIERARDLLPQIKANHCLEYDFATYGLKLIAWGYFKKIVIADTLAVFVKEVFQNPYDYHGLSLILATLAFTIEIYCDFSGYSDIAIGTARLFGIKLMNNFRSPYFSASIKEFWGRWHISLSSWMKDYVYIPLGGNRVSFVRHKLNLLLTFLVSGLWHGANWTFVIWGGIHGIAQVIESIIFQKRDGAERRLGIVLRVVATFLICSAAWVFFAANSLGDAAYIFSHYFDGINNPIMYFKNGMQTNLSWISIRCLVVSLLILVVFDYFSLKQDVIAVISSMKKPLRWGIYVSFMMWLIMNVQLTDNSQFIYFQF